MKKTLTLFLVLLASAASVGAQQEAQVSAAADVPPQIAGGQAEPGTTLDIAAYELLKENERDVPGAKEWDNILVFKNSSVRVSLAPSYYADHHDNGPDPATLKVEWLIPGQIVWIKWNSYLWLGSGADSTEAHILLLLDADKATEVARQAFRFSGKNGGAAECNRQSASFEAGTAVSGTPRIVRRVFDYHTYSPFCYEYDGDEPRALALRTRGDTASWSIAYRFYEEVAFQIQDGKLVESPRCPYSLKLDLSAPLNPFEPETPFRETVPIEEVAEFLVPFVAPRYGRWRGSGSCTPEERERMVRDLREQNSLKEGVTTLSGMVRVPWKGPAIFPPMTPENDFYPFARSDEHL